jgi:Rieske Fe-S protein
MIITGKINGGGMEFPFTQTIKKPNGMLMEMTIQGMTMKQGYDGTTAWMINPFQGNKNAEKMPKEQEKYMKEQAEIEGQLVNYKEKGSTVELLGKEDMEGSEVYKIKLTDKDGDVTTYYLDASSYLVLKQESKRKIKEKEISSTITMGNYKSIDGYMVPHSVEIKSSNEQMGTQNVIIEKVEMNTPVEDNIFAMPENK